MLKRQSPGFVRFALPYRRSSDRAAAFGGEDGASKAPMIRPSRWPPALRPAEQPAEEAGGTAVELTLADLTIDLSEPCVDLSECASLQGLPDNLHVRRLKLSGCRSLRGLPAGLRCYELELRETPVRSLPADLRVEYRLDLTGCTALEELPPGLKVGSLVLEGCTALNSLPEGLDVYFLNISGCTALTEWPRQAQVRIGHLHARGCTGFTALPAWLKHLAQLDVSGCTRLARLPDGLQVSSWIDLADTAIRSLPASLQGVRLRWRGVPIDERIAFRPETITAAEILNEPNAELRRVLMERMGSEAFLGDADAEVLDTDTDAGGERRLLRVPLQGDEDLVCVSVLCPSTGRQYALRVPPGIRTCRQAAAWIAGFDDPDDYQPIAET
jgi:hypothetical protein